MSDTATVGVAGIASVGRGNGNGMKFNLPKTLSNPTVWGWLLYAAAWAWLLGLFAMMGGYKGDVAS